MESNSNKASTIFKALLSGVIVTIMMVLAYKTAVKRTTNELEQSAVIHKNPPENSDSENSSSTTSSRKEIVDAKKTNTEPTHLAEAPKCAKSIFVHQKEKGHEDSEDCFDHKNAIDLDSALLGFKQYCVRVDGIAVAYERHGNQILLEPGAGPHSKIAIEACDDEKFLQKKCVIQKRALLGGLLETDRKPAAANGKNGGHTQELDQVSALESEMRNEVKELVQEEVYRGWKKQ